MKTMKEWGLVNVHEETWPFGRGWQNQRFIANAVTPRAYPLIAYPKAWTPGTNGPVTGDAVIAVINEEKDFAEFKGKLRGKYVLSMAMRDVPAHFDAQGRRYTDAELADARQAAAGRRRTRPGQLRGGAGLQPQESRSSSSTRAWPRCSTSAAATAARCSSRRLRACRAIRKARRNRRRSP